MMTMSKKVSLLALLTVLPVLQACEPLLGCGVAPANQSEASLYVVDAQTGEPVVLPTFVEVEAEETLNAYCQEQRVNTFEYYLLYLERTTHTILISAPGYVSQEVSFDLLDNASIHLAVELEKN